MLTLNGDSVSMAPPYFTANNFTPDGNLLHNFSQFNRFFQRHNFGPLNGSWLTRLDGPCEIGHNLQHMNSAQNLPHENDADVVHSNSTALTKDKTPMAQVVDLARFNHVTHQYVLQNESGPAHCKTFVVKLILGEKEQFEGEGFSIKKAQQNAAANAIEKTNFSKPSTSSKKAYSTGISPTVRLNAVLSKLSLSAEYANFSVQYPQPANQRNYCFNTGFTRLRPHPPYPINGQFLRFAPMPPAPNFRFCPPLHTVRLKIGHLDFFGRGPTRQVARHDAAQQALGMLQNFCEQRKNFSESQAEHPENSVSFVDSGKFPAQSDFSMDFNLKAEKSNAMPESLLHVKTESLLDNAPIATQLTENLGDSTKSPISIVHELASCMKMSIDFEVISETGPAHDRLFVVEVGLSPVVQNGLAALTCRGSGLSKKMAKNDACVNFVEKLVKNDKNLFATYLLIVNCKPQAKNVKPRRETIIKDSKMDPNYGEEINPVSRLVQVQQAKKESEPKFEFLHEIGQGRYKEYVMQVTVGENNCQATGPNKKLAKRSAAELMLEKMGLNKPLPKAGKPVLKHPKVFVSREHSPITDYQEDENQANLQDSLDQPDANSISALKLENSQTLDDKKKSENLQKRRVTFFDVSKNASERQEEAFKKSSDEEAASRRLSEGLPTAAASPPIGQPNSGWNTTDTFLPKRSKRKIRTLNTALMNLTIDNEFTGPSFSGAQGQNFVAGIDSNPLPGFT